MTGTVQVPVRTYLKDYQPPSYLIPNVRLHFDIGSEETVLRAELECIRAAGAAGHAPLILDGRGIELRSIKLDGRELREEDFSANADRLLIARVPSEFKLTIVTAFKPHENKSGLGVYQSGDAICTQMEAQGFRLMTYYPDRPDVMSCYEVTLQADKGRYPVLLSNGDCISSRDLPGGRHEAVYRDPFPKPSYLFALVAGDLGRLDDHFVTKSGRTVALQIFCTHGKEARCRHAMESLKKAMRWDEQVYGLEYDLNTYSIVAVDDFNAGAMENKGLNIFNSTYVLADDASASDEDFFEIERVIAHEYFHNWTGNRVTLRDWFQLTLKEGLTVLRDQEFAGDMSSPAVERIRNARIMRERQFLEDAGPNSHPIRPDSYIEIDNFYTSTVYRKGAEVIGMLKTLLGSQTFRKGVREYLRRFDGKAATTEDFLAVFSEVGGIDLSQFSRWYHQAGTPVVKAHERFDQNAGTYTLEFEQSCGQSCNPLQIPIALGLIGSDGRELSAESSPELSSWEEGKLLELRDVKAEVAFKNIAARPVPSLLRNFSAPVDLQFAYSDEDLTFLLAHDPDPFNRFEAGQRLGLNCLRKMYFQARQGESPALPAAIAQAYCSLVSNEGLDPYFRAQALTLPSLQVLCASLDTPDFNVASAVRRSIFRHIAAANRGVFHDYYDDLSRKVDAIKDRDPLTMGRRALKNICLSYLATEETAEAIELASRQFKADTGMTDCYAALRCLSHIPGPAKDFAFQTFYDRWKNDAVVMDIWISLHIAVPSIDVLPVVKRLEIDPAIDRKSPNKIQALYGTFSQNLPRFHDPSGSGYSFFVDRILWIDSFNPNVAAGLVKSFHWFPRLDAQRKPHAKRELERLVSTPGISKGVFEIAQSTLQAGNT